MPHSSTTSIRVERLRPEAWRLWRDLRLQALAADAPVGFALVELVQVVRDEAARGLDPDRRVVMQYRRHPD